MNDITQKLINKIQDGDKLGTYDLYAKWLSQDEKFFDGTVYNQRSLYLKQAIEVLALALVKSGNKKDLHEATDSLIYYGRKFDEINGEKNEKTG